MSDPYEALSAMLDVARGEQWYAAPEGSPARDAYALASAALSGKPKDQPEKPKTTKKKGK